MIKLKHEEEILKIHNLLPERYVILKSTDDTRRRGWLSKSNNKVKELIGQTGSVTKVHNNVFEAVRVRFLNGDERFWSYKDLELVDSEATIEPKIFHFDISLLNVGV